MKYACDTGAVISLASSKFSDLIFKEYTIILTPTVIQELHDFDRYSDFLGQMAGNILKRNFKIEHAEKKVDLRLSSADGEVFSLALEKKYLALTDDVHAARVAQEKLNLKSYHSFYLLLQLYKKKKITKDELKEEINTILRKRNWLKGALGKYALEITETL